jgi:hypothetical protein
MNANQQAEGLPQQAFQLGDVKTMATDDAAVEKEDGYIESVATLEHRVAIDVDDFDGGQGSPASQGVQLAQHLVA